MEKRATKTFFILIVITLFFVMSTGCGKKKSSEPVSKTNIFMGTVCTIKIYDNPKEEYFQDTFNLINDIESKMSINVEDSELIRVNNQAGKSKVKVSDDTFFVIQKGLEYSAISAGKFDITIGPLVDLWSIGFDNQKVPKEEEIKEKIEFIDYKDLVLDQETKEVYLNKEGMMIDLGAIAKGYTADAIKETLLKNNVKKAIINMGGNVLLVGSNIGNEDFKIGIQDPVSNKGNYVGIVSIKDKSIVTSGIYERYIEQDGKRYHHLLNPFKGYPWENDIAGVSIISDKSIDGDALSTTVFSMGVKDGFDFIENIENVEAIFITKDKEIILTKGIKDSFKLTNDTYKIIQ